MPHRCQRRRSRRIAASLAAALLQPILLQPFAAMGSVESGFGVATGGGASSGEESFKSDLFTGAAAYEIPIVVPAGSNGFQPQLTLSYNSHRGGGWVGRGWDLALPSISRMTKFGIPAYVDDPATGDWFALIGDRLVRDDIGVYRTMRDNFARIERVESPPGVISHWILRRTDGVTQWFGSTLDSQIKNPNDSDKVFRWLLSRAEDANGNYISYEYYLPTAPESQDEGSAYPKRISYGFTGDSPSTVRSIDFTLNGVQRPDKTIVYTGGFRQERSKRLEIITVRAGGAVVTSYELLYTDEDLEVSDPPNAASLLRKVIRKGSDGSSTLPADTFSYSGSAPLAWSPNSPLEMRLEDLKLGAGVFLESFNLSTGNWRILEVNGDGAPDIVGTKVFPSGRYVSVYLNTRDSEVFPSTPIPPAFAFDFFTPPSIFDDTQYYYNAPVWADFTGDGRVDVLEKQLDVGTPLIDPGQNFSYSFVNTGYTWANTGPLAPVPTRIVNEDCEFLGFDQWIRGRSVLADVNGDGLADLLHHALPNADRVCASGPNLSLWTVRAVYLNTGTGWVHSPGWSTALATILGSGGFNNFLRKLVFFDLNADGLVDVGEDDGGDGAIDGTPNSVVWLNTGRGWISDVDISAPEGLRPVDLNGDGLLDHAGATPRLGTGTQFGAPVTLPAPWNLHASAQAIVDLDGDGLADLLQADTAPAGTSDVQVQIATPTVPADRLERVEQGTGATVDLTYSPSTAGECHDPLPGGCHESIDGVGFDPADFGATPSDCTFPFWFDGGPEGSGLCTIFKESLPLVAQTLVSTIVNPLTGPDAIRTDLAHYDFGHYDAKEREFRGFGQVWQRPQTHMYPSPKGGALIDLGVLRLTNFYQESFLRGAVWREALFSSSDGDPDTPGEVKLEESWTDYAITRGDASLTLLVRQGSFEQSCEPQDPDVPDPAGPCEYVDLQDPNEPYANPAYITLPAPHPYDGFQNDFCGPTNPTNRDCAFAYLVLPIGKTTYQYDVSPPSPLTLQTTRWFDNHGNVQATYSDGDSSDPSDDRIAVIAFAAPTGPASNFFSRPRFIVQQTPIGTVVTRTRIDYDGLINGVVSRGNVTTTLRELIDPVSGGAPKQVSVTRMYPETGNAGLPSVVSDPFIVGQESSRFTSYEYDARKAFVSITTRGGLTSETLYDPTGAPPGLGVLRQTEDENGVTVDYSADAFGRATGRTGPSPIGAVESASYGNFQGYNPSAPRLTVTRTDGNGNTVSVKTFTDGLGRAIRTEQDGLDESDAIATIVRATTYDKLGRVSFESRPGFGAASSSGTSFYYDTRGRVRFVKEPDNAGQPVVQEIQYDGLLTTTYDAESRRRDTLRDGASSVVRVTEYPNGAARSTDYVYDFVGRLGLVCYSSGTSCGTQSGPGGLSVASDPRHSIVIDYDTLGRRVRLVDPDSGDWRYTYDGSGNVLTERDARLLTVSYTYDAVFGRRETENWDGDPDPQVTLTYGDELASPPPNSKGRVVTSAEPTVTWTYGYDGVGRVTSTTAAFLGGGSHTMTNGYDWWDRTTSTTYPTGDGEVVTRVYDRMGVDRVCAAPIGSLCAGATRTYVTDVKHNAEGNLRKLDYGNGNIRELNYFSTTGYLQSLTGSQAGVNFLSRSYAYDRTTRIQSITDAVESSESLSGIAYDGVGRIKTATRGGVPLSYGYDDLGNLTSKEGVAQPFTHPTKPHAIYDATQPTRFSYDANGNLTRRSNTTLEYDRLNRLVFVSGRLPSIYAYGRGGERVRKQHGADLSFFLGPDYEVQNGVRFVKTIRVEGMIVAQISIGPGPGGGASVLPGSREPFDPATLAVSLASLLTLAALAGLLARGGAYPAWQRGFATGLSLALATAPGLSALAAAPGDVREDGQLDPADALLLQRELAEPAFVLTPEQEQSADVAPFANGEPQGNDILEAADLLVLLQGLSSPDFDGDGLLGQDDPVPLSRSNFDADQDGLDDDAEGVAGTLQNDFDTDNDGIVDGKDGDPLNQAGTQVLFLHADHLGGSAVVTNDATPPVVVRKVRYGIFGEVRANDRVGPASTLDPAEKYTSQRFDAETGFAYYGARYYDPALGRFSQPDPIVSSPYGPQSFNRYAYVLNDPLNFIDPTGLQACGEDRSCSPEPDPWLGGNPFQNPTAGFVDDLVIDLFDWLNGVLDAMEDLSSLGLLEGEPAGGLALDRSQTSSITSEGGTIPLWRACTGGDDAACSQLEATNAADLQDALDHIRRVAPEVLERADDPTITFDASERFFKRRAGTTHPLTGNITLARGYVSKEDFVSTVAEELMHSGEGVFGRALTNIQDRFLPGPVGLGARHSATRSRADAIADLYGP